MPEDIPEDSLAPIPEMGKTKTEVPKELQPTPNQQAVDDILWDIPFARPVWNFFVREGKAVKNGWVAVILIVGIACWFAHSWTEEGVDAKISEATNYFGGELAKREQEISDIKGQLSDYKNDLREANRQKDVASQRLDYFQSNPEKLSEIYSNIFAHSPTNFQQVDLMLAQYNEALTNNLAEIETTTKQLEYNVGQSQYSTGQLADLGIEKLPDGRIKFGGVVTGAPKVIMGAMEAGMQSARNNDFHAALTNLQTAITAFELTKPSGVMLDTSSNLTTVGKSYLYNFAGEAAHGAGSNYLAIEYQKKAIEYANQALKENSDDRAKGILVAALADLGNVYLNENDFTNSFEFFNAAITNYESINSPTNFVLDETHLFRLYGSAAFTAFRSGKTNETAIFGKKASEIFGELNNKSVTKTIDRKQ